MSTKGYCTFNMIHLTHKNQGTKPLQFYHLDIIPSLLGSWAAQREWGVIGSKVKRQVDWYDSREQAQEVIAQLAESKINTWFGTPGIPASRKVSNKSVKSDLKNLDSMSSQRTLWAFK